MCLPVKWTKISFSSGYWEPQLAMLVEMSVEVSHLCSL